MCDTEIYEEFLFFWKDKLEGLCDEYDKFVEGKITERELQKQFKKKIDALILKSVAFRECLKFLMLFRDAEFDFGKAKVYLYDDEIDALRKILEADAE